MNMTNEQIEQNATNFAINETNGIAIKFFPCKNGYIAGAHSRDEEIGRMNTTIRLYAIQIAQLRKEIEQLRNPWISVKDRLPEKAKGLYKLEEDEHHKMVLFKTANGRLYIGYLDAEEIWRAFTVPYKGACPIDRFTWSRVAHWMPMPKV